MSVINPLAREISAKIVFYGPGLSGKTTSLQYIHSTIRPTYRGDLVSLATEGDRTLYFDFLPIQLERVRGMHLRLQLFTVPGQVFYGATRQLVLDGADGVVFVADSQMAARERNLESLVDLEANLEAEGKSVDTMPLVLQYNKRDLPGCMSIEEMQKDLNPHGAPHFQTSAATGMGVIEALKEVVRLVTRALSERDTQPRVDFSKRKSLDAASALRPVGEDAEDISSQVQSALSSMGSQVVAVAPAGGAVDTPGTTRQLGDWQQGKKDRDNAQTVQAPPAATLSFKPLWEDSTLVETIEQAISTGHFAEAVHRAASGVSEILDGLLGPHVDEGSGTRAQLLGLEGREYLELRRLASRPASTITQTEALFAYYVFIAARVKESSLAR